MSMLGISTLIEAIFRTRVRNLFIVSHSMTLILPQTESEAIYDYAKDGGPEAG